MSAAMEARAQDRGGPESSIPLAGGDAKVGDTSHHCPEPGAGPLISTWKGAPTSSRRRWWRERPVLASHIAGSVGLLGEDYPGYFPVGDTRALAQLLHRVESEPAFLQELREWCAALAAHFHPDREREAWEALLREIAPESGA